MNDQLSTFSIAELVLGLHTDYELKKTNRFVPFVTDENEEFHIFITEKESLKELDGHLVYQESCFDVIQCKVDDKVLFCRRYYDEAKRHFHYANVYYDWEQRNIRIEYLKQGFGCLNQTNNAFYHLAFDKLMSLESRMILHSCLVSTEFGGILFSGPSGIGKSTQGDLWCQYENGRILNGDRPILYKKEDDWYAAGSPFAGSSGYHINEKEKVRALVFLKQGNENTIRGLNASKAYRFMLEQVSVGFWDSEFVLTISALIEAFISEIPVYELTCTPDRRAVDLLKETLLRN